MPASRARTGAALFGALAVSAAGCTARAPAGAGSAPVFQYQGSQHVAVYGAGQARAAERSLGYRVVEPTAAVRIVAGLPLAEVIVTEVAGAKAIHYVYGDLHGRWVLVLEVSDPNAAYSYDAASREVLFGARGCGIDVTTDLSTATLRHIVRSLGGPRQALEPPA